ncbi:MAG: hypothetical protein P8Q92_10470 [Pseudoprimorskyibacter sp.]|nr:hypothetical protein [Pseudoprimorskyibacter sp.]
MSAPTILDKILFLRSGILEVVTLGKIGRCAVSRIRTQKRNTYLKFNVPGNIQYHKVNKDIAEKTYREILSFENE